jgi:acetylglutamate kinase
VKVLVKLGGTLLDEDISRKALATQLAAAMQRTGLELVVVHGGGKQMTRFLAERGVESRFVAGLRVTTPDVVDAVLKVFAGSVNHQLIASLVAAGVPAVGLSGIDACLVEAEQLNPDLGAVGKPVRANPRLLHVLVEAGFLPVVACVAGDRLGNIYNVNADQMASACAAGFGAEKLIFLTDVQGVLDGGKAIISTLTSSDSQNLIATGVATGGMQAKLESAQSALEGGTGQVLIAPGAEPDILARLLDGEPIGTRFVA